MFGRQRVSSRDKRTLARRVLRVGLALAVLSVSAWAQTPELVSEEESPELVSEEGCTPGGGERGVSILSVWSALIGST